MKSRYRLCHTDTREEATTLKKIKSYFFCPLSEAGGSARASFSACQAASPPHSPLLTTVREPVSRSSPLLPRQISFSSRPQPITRPPQAHTGGRRARARIPLAGRQRRRRLSEKPPASAPPPFITSPSRARPTRGLSASFSRAPSSSPFSHRRSAPSLRRRRGKGRAESRAPFSSSSPPGRRRSHAHRSLSLSLSPPWPRPPAAPSLPRSLSASAAERARRAGDRAGPASPPPPPSSAVSPAAAAASSEPTVACSPPPPAPLSRAAAAAAVRGGEGIDVEAESGSAAASAMQPPPRKVKITQELKLIQAEQMTKIQAKHQAECDLLEDMRIFSQKKAAIEREYAQGIQKLASQYLKKEWPGIKADDRHDFRSMYPVWKSFLEGTVQVAQSRLNICENYKNLISEPARAVKCFKEQQLKKCVDQLTRIQAELQETVKDLAKGKKKYFETEQMAHAVREKADIEAKSKLSLFQSRISLQKASVKLKARRSECNSKATHARNDYLLTLAAANAHQDRYYQTDLVNIMKALDGNVCDHLKDYLMAFSRTELEVCQAVQSTFQFLLETSSRSRQLESETGTTEEHSLNKEARKWATRVAREHKNIIHTQRTLEELECHGSVVSEQSRAELEQKIDETRENIRKAEIIKLKAEARLDLLKQIGVSVDTWLKSAMNQVMEELENERWASLPTVANNGSSHLLNVDMEKEEGEELEDGMDAFDDSSSSPSGTLRNYPLTCKVVYSYKASQPDELTIEEHEVLEVIEDGDMEDWVKARNKSGHVGYVPEKYLQFPTSNSLLSMLQSLAALDSRSHTSSNSTEAELVSGSLNGDSSVCFVKALYDYEGQTDDELSFPEGAIIRILNKENQDDDGFWEGEFNGCVGVFPSVLVEELTASENGEIQCVVDAQVSPSPAPQNSLAPLPLYDQPPTSPFHSPDKRSSQYFPRSPTTNVSENSYTANSPGFSQPPRPLPESTSYGKLRPVRAAPPPPTQHRRPTEKIEDVEITLV
uniref:F-BAR and double SH3 domains protein 2 n=1 Tax=Podarcis muralis TaxID=64176 RepID=A0A670HMN0_PODMU